MDAPRPDAPALALVASHVAESWRRCRGMGLSSEILPRLDPLASVELRCLLERDLRLAQAAREELRTLSQALADTGNVLMLVDDQGLLVAVAGDVAHTGSVLCHARPGVDVGEHNFGTNALGTALVEQRPIVVRRGEHFLARLRHMECVAAPIFSPDGRLIGALDVSTDTRPLVPGLMDLVQGSVMRIERLLLRDLRSPAILRLHPHPEYLGTSQEGLVALGADGEVLGMNSLAARVLGVAPAQAVGRPLARWLDGDPYARPRSGGALQLRARAGIGLYGSFEEAPDLESRRLRTRGGRAAPPAEAPPDRPALIEPLSAREQEILECLARGASNRNLARQMFVSENTVKYHLKNLYAKLGVRGRLQALVAARRYGFIR